jgi:hypothetical protein
VNPHLSDLELDEAEACVVIPFIVDCTEIALSR